MIYIGHLFWDITDAQSLCEKSLVEISPPPTDVRNVRYKVCEECKNVYLEILQ
jgi:hypothetical protein